MADKEYDLEGKPVKFDEDEAEVKGPREDSINPQDMVEMFHPDLPNGSDGEPKFSTVSRVAFEDVWQEQGWQLRSDDEYAPSEEQRAAMAAAEAEDAHDSDEDADTAEEVSAPNDKE